MHTMRRLRQGLSVRVDYVPSTERDTGDLCGPDTMLPLRGCALHCGLRHRGVAPCRGARADTHGTRGCLAQSLHGRAGVPCLRIEMSDGCPLDGFRPTASCGDRRTLCGMRSVRTSVRDSERSRGYPSHAISIVVAAALVTHKPNLNPRRRGIYFGKSLV